MVHPFNANFTPTDSEFHTQFKTKVDFNAVSNHRFCIAPMMDWSDKHCRFFWRILTKRAFLYTEMVTTGALLHGDRSRFLSFTLEEHPVALQLGGSNPNDLAKCAAIAQEWGYDEVNLNCGCPSDRVQSGKIGAILMAEPALVADCIAAMIDACAIPVTIKHRIGIDHMDDYPAMHNFVATVAQAGCKTFIVHARKAWLKGLSPKQNREVPPLRYELIFQLKKAFPDLEIIINGGISTIEQCQFLLGKVDGVMIGREAYQNPYFLAGIDQALFGAPESAVCREEVLGEFARYMATKAADGVQLHHMTRHILGLYTGRPGARGYRRYLTEKANQTEQALDLIHNAIQCTK